MKLPPAIALFATIACLPISCRGLAGNNVVANMPSLTSGMRSFATEAHQPAKAQTKSALSLSGGGGNEPSSNMKDYGPEMSALFGNIRVPAALFAGASAGAAFALPLGSSDGLRIGFVKRIYALLMMSALSCQLLAIIVATLSMGTIAVSASEAGKKKASCLADYITEYFFLSWTTCHWNFLAGIFAFVVGQGMRAWITVSCPIFAKAALGIITSSTVLAIAFVEENDRKRAIAGASSGLLGLTARYVHLMLKKATKDPMFALGTALSAITWGYVCWNIPHVWQYLEMH